MISREEVHKLVRLSRVGISEKEEGKLQKDLEAILGYVEKLKEVDVSGVPEMTHAVESKNVFREDVHRERTHEDKLENLLTDQFPEIEAGYLRVKNVFERD